MADVLKRITSEYSQTEDRIRITGETAKGQPMVLWMTQRLLSKLVAHLCETLTGQDNINPRASAMNHFAQQAATLAKSTQAPVLARQDTEAFLVQSVDVARTPNGVRLLFKEREGNAVRTASIALNTVQLRQWLAILRELYGKAAWPLQIWPEWIDATPTPLHAAENALLH